MTRKAQSRTAHGRNKRPHPVYKRTGLSRRKWNNKGPAFFKTRDQECTSRVKRAARLAAARAAEEKESRA